LREQLKGGRIYFGSWIETIQSTVAWHHTIGQKIMVVGAHGGDVIHLIGEGKQRREGTRTRYNLQRCDPTGLLPPTRLYLPKFLPLLKIVPQTGDQAVNM
jgi:hypothetical protein